MREEIGSQQQNDNDVTVDITQPEQIQQQNNAASTSLLQTSVQMGSSSRWQPQIAPPAPIESVGAGTRQLMPRIPLPPRHEASPQIAALTAAKKDIQGKLN